MMTVINFKKTISFLILISTIFFISGAGVIAQPPVQPPGLDIAIEVQEAHTPALMEDPDIVGTAVGLNDDGEPVIKVFANTGKARGIPDFIEGIPVAVEVTGMFFALSDPTIRFPRPVPIGVSTGHPDITAGTIGCRVTDGPNVYALSNNHVYANSNNASIGDSALQPGPYDGGHDPADKIGELWDFEPIKFNGGDNYIDAAIGITSPSNLDTATPGDGYGVPDSSIFGDNDGDGYFDNRNQLLNLIVKKFGRTTKLTGGYISGINATVDVCYQCGGIFCFTCKKSARFKDQIVIKPGDFSAGGDSGSLIVSYSGNKPVGLLFAGSDAQTIANRIDLVLKRFDVAVDDGAGGLSVTGCSGDADCGDGDACNGVETCSGGVCQAGQPLDCNDGNVCTDDSCNSASGCVNTNNNASCDDGDACTTSDTCSGGVCQAGQPLDCNDGNVCTDDSCNSASGCVNTNICCAPKGADCADDIDCCSNKCRGKLNSKTCK